MFFDFNLMANRRYNLNNSSRPSGSANGTGTSSPSPAPASGNSKTASSNKASQNSGAPVPGVLLGLSGGWLVARMFFFGGTLWLIEIIAISVAAGFVYPKGGKVQKRFATAIIGIALLNLFVPGINPGVKQIRETQLNTTEEMYPIVIDKDGVYELPNRPLKVCFKQTGSSSTIWIDQEVSIDNSWRVVENYSKCHNIPKYASGKKVHISLGNAIKKYTPEIIMKWNITNPNITNDYEYYANIEGGQSGYPIIQDQ